MGRSVRQKAHASIVRETASTIRKLRRFPRGSEKRRLAASIYKWERATGKGRALEIYRRMRRKRKR